MEIVFSDSSASITVNTIGVVPESPSSAVTSLCPNATEGAGSLSNITQTADPPEGSISAPSGFARTNEKYSSSSCTVSPFILTLITPLVCPAGILSVPAAAI